MVKKKKKAKVAKKVSAKKVSKKKTVTKKAVKKKVVAKKVAKKKVASKKVGKKKTVAKKAVAKIKAVKKVAKKAVKKIAVNKVSVKAKVKEALVIQDVSKVADKVKTPRTKSEVFRIVAEASGLSKKEVGTVFEKLADLIDMDLGKKGPGVFNFPGMMKIVRVTKPATKARKGINPFTKEPMVFKAKPARNGVKVRPLKGLKEMAES